MNAETGLKYSIYLYIKHAEDTSAAHGSSDFSTVTGRGMIEAQFDMADMARRESVLGVAMS